MLNVPAPDPRSKLLVPYGNLDNLALRVGVASHQVLFTGEPSLHGRRCRPSNSPCETPADISAYLDTHATRELAARERLQAFFAA